MSMFVYINDQKGISILEIMVAILILTTGFLAVAKLQSQAMKDLNWSQTRTTAVLLAQSYIESIPFDDLDDFHGESNKKVVDVDNHTYTILTNINPLGNAATQKTIEISVSWENKTITLETIRFP